MEEIRLTKAVLNYTVIEEGETWADQGKYGYVLSSPLLTLYSKMFYYRMWAARK
jgi:hypothetical protein